MQIEIFSSISFNITDFLLTFYLVWDCKIRKHIVNNLHI